MKMKNSGCLKKLQSVFAQVLVATAWLDEHDLIFSVFFYNDSFFIDIWWVPKNFSALD